MADDQTDVQDVQDQTTPEDTGDTQDTQVEPEVRDYVPTSDVEVNKDDYDPYDVDKVKSVAKSAVKPVEEDLFRLKVNDELRSLFDEHPEYKQYESKIRTFVNHPNRQKFIKEGLPVKSVALEAIESELMKIGAQKAMEAQAEANKSKGGTQQTTPPVTPDLKDKMEKMSPEEFRSFTEKVKRGEFLQE